MHAYCTNVVPITAALFAVFAIAAVSNYIGIDSFSSVHHCSPNLAEQFPVAEPPQVVA